MMGNNILTISLIILILNLFELNTKNILSQKAIKEVIVLLNHTVNDKIEISNIKDIKYISKKNIFNIGLSKIYEIHLQDAKVKLLLSERDKKYFFIQTDQQQYIIQLDTLILISSQNKQEYYIAGYNNSRGYGKFRIYDLTKKDSQIIFETKEDTYNYSLDCNSYNNRGYLGLKNVDLDNDGYLDLEFKGISYIFCKGKEVGFSRIDRTPLTQKDLSFQYYYDSKLHTWVGRVQVPE